MGGGAVLFAVSILYLIEAQGLQHVFVQHGKDLHLDVKKPDTLDQETEFLWKFNKIKIVRINHDNAIVVYGRFKRRAELLESNYSLLLKNVTHSDTGHYSAVVSGETDQTAAEYKVIVQDRVTPAELRVDHVSRNSDFCILSVTCTTVDLNISSTFRCDGQNCSQVEEKSLNTTKNFSFLIVYLQHDTIFCNHSNKVSCEQSTEAIKSSCETKPVPSKAIIAGISTVTFCVLTFLTVLCIARKCKRGNMENTVYEVPQDILPGQTQNQTLSGNDSCQSPTSTYALVEFHTEPKSTKTKDIPQPETVYAQVNRAAKPESTSQQSTPRTEEPQ